MEFHRSNHPRANKQINADTNYLELDVFDEDDIFYDELRRQVLLLTADDNEEFSETKHSDFISTRKRDSNSLTSFRPRTLQPGSYFNWWETENNDLVPAWLLNLWKNGNGTGVFIPQIVKSRRYKQGRMNNRRRRAYKRGVIQHTVNNTAAN